MGSKCGKEGTWNNEGTADTKGKCNWRKKMSARRWHERFSSQKNIEVNGERKLEDKIKASEVHSITERGDAAIDEANHFTFIYTKDVTLYKKAKKNKQVSLDMKKQELTKGVKLTDFVDTYEKVEKMIEKANNGSMIVEQLNDFDEAYDQLKLFNKELSRKHSDNPNDQFFDIRYDIEHEHGPHQFGGTSANGGL